MSISEEYGAFNYYSYPKYVSVEDLQATQPNGVMSSTVSLPNHTFTWQT